MKKYVVYSTSDMVDLGYKILRYGVCPDSMVNMQAKDGEAVATVPVGTTVDNIDYEMYNGNVRELDG